MECVGCICTHAVVEVVWCVVCGACGVCGVWRMVWRMVRGGTRVLILVFSFLLYTWHTNDLDYRL